ncbi:MAG: radical SAM family heme chaperone HemW [Flavobacteriales bacterium]
MSGIYVHIPFCKQKCSYCDFHFSTNLKLQNDLVDSLCKEIELQKDYLSEAPQTLYFGGGTPSILSQENLSRIFEALHKYFDLSQLSEVTFESNPDDHSVENLRFWKSLGINRLSIGIQSFIDRDLKLMNRAHNADHAKQCVEQAREAGFESLSIDLIYGIPDQSFDQWKANVQEAIQLNPDHISAYCLTVEPKTALAHMVAKGEIFEKSDEVIEQEYLYLHQTLEAAGYEHYEVSNFSKPGKRAAHNSNYWSGKAYLGIGPSAHSFDGNRKRQWNISNNPTYIKKLRTSEEWFDTETLKETERYNEMIMTGLRTKSGIDISAWPSKTQEELLSSIHKLPTQLKSSIAEDHGRIRISPERWLVSDAIIREIILSS